VKTKLPKARIIAVSPFWDFAAPPPELKALGQSVKQDVPDVGGTYLNVGSPLAGQRQYFSADAMHPNPEGSRCTTT
jgi:acyl-CoA thioesterase-1